MCVREKSHGEAKSLCSEVGGRLCTAFELQSNEGDPEACGYGSIFKWSWADTPPGACPSANQSLGMPGGVGSWFSFVPTVLNTYHEVQIRSRHALDGDTFLIRGVFDADAAIIAGQLTTLHRRKDGVMLRWNATQVGSEVFVHVSSTADGAVYTVAAVLPQEYSWRRVLAQAQQTDAPEAMLEIHPHSAVRVDLPFQYRFFGIEYDAVWVTASGVLQFEEPGVAGFAATGAAHSAILVAVGEFDLSRAGASVTTSQLSPTELRVSWHAPLFSSAVFSDVSVVLAKDGNVTIGWERLDLSGGGSLESGLASHISVDSEHGATYTTAGNGQARLVGTANAVNTSVGVIYGAGPGEGLDFQGQFVYALNLGGLGPLAVGDAVFTRVTSSTPGVSIHTSGDGLYSDTYFGATVGGDRAETGGYLEDHVSLPWINMVAFSSNTADARNLAFVLNSYLIIGPWVGASKDTSVTITLLVNPGMTYRVQALIAGMNPTTHISFFDMRVNGELVMDNFNMKPMKVCVSQMLVDCRYM